MTALTKQARRGRTTAALTAVLGLMAALVVPTAAASAAPSQDPAVAAAATTSTGPVVSQEVTDAVADGGSAFVIANLAAPTNAPQAIESTARAVLEELPEGSYQGEARAQDLPFVALLADASAIEALRSDVAVTSVVLDHINTASLVNSVPAIGGDLVRSAGFDGSGTAVAILDTGITAFHPFFRDAFGNPRVVAESCFSGGGGAYGLNALSLCPGGGYQETGPGSSFPCKYVTGTIFPMPCGHGTHVAGIAAGANASNDGTSAPKYGVAPNSSIISVDVFSLLCSGTVDVNTGSCSSGFQFGALDSDIALALNWVNNGRFAFNLAAVNLSVGGSAHYSTSCDASTVLASPIATLRANGVATVVASGNDSSKAGISSPACVSSAVSVGSWDLGTNTVSSFSNSAGNLTLLAPGDRNDGQGIVSSVPVSGPLAFSYAAATGTSMAAPHVAGALAILHAAHPGEDVTSLVARLTSTGTTVLDASNGVSKPLINLDKAMRSAPTLNVYTPVQGDPYPGSTLTTSIGVAGYPTPTVSYQWYRCPTTANDDGHLPPGCTTLVGQTSSSYTIVVADIGSFPTVGVTASNGVDPSTSGYASSFLVPSLPAAPGGPYVTIDAPRSISLTWSPAWPDGLPITGYRLVMTPQSPAGAAVTLDLPAGTTSHTFTGLTPGTLYYFTVAQKNVNGFGPPSNGGWGTPYGPPGAPTGVVGSPADGSALISFTAPADEGNNPITSYTVTAAPGGQTCTALAPALGCKVSGLQNGTPYTFTVTAQNAAGPGPASSPSAPVAPVAGFRSITPTRYLDTRTPVQGGGGTFDGANSGTGAVGSGQTITMKVAGRGPVPADATAVALNVTVAGSTGGGYLTVYEAGVTAPLASNLNFYPGQVVPNMVISKVGTNGEIAIKNVGGSTPVIVDVVGYFAAGSLYTPLVPARLMDTRTPAEGAQSVDGAFVNTGPIPSGGTRTLTVAGRGGVPASGVGAVALNVTVAGSTGGGYVTVYESGVSAPLASNLNFYPGQVVPNMVVTKVGADGKVVIKNVGGTTPIVVDVVGWFPTDPGGLTPIVPARLMDTRPVHQGAATVDGGFVGTGWFFDGTTRTLPVVGRGGVPAEGVSAVVLNVTVAGSTGGGYLSVFQSGVAAPLASNLNFYPGQVVPNMVIAKVGADGSIAIKNVGGSTDIVVDVVGWFP